MTTFSRRLSTNLRRAVRRFFTHTLEWTAATEDVDGNISYDGQTPTEEVPCVFLWQDTTTDAPEGPVTQKIPVVYVDSSYDIQPNDLITNVLDKDALGVLLVSAVVSTVDPTAEGGLSVMNVLTLKGAVTQ